MAKAKQLFGTFIVLFMLVGLPAISYYYLSQGYAYRKEAILTQGDYGKMPDLNTLPTVRGKQPERYRGAMTVVGWLDPAEKAASNQYGQMLDSLYQQFQDSPNLYFSTLVAADDPAAAAATFADKHNLPEDEMIAFLATDDDRFTQMAEAFKLPLEENVVPGQTPIVALVDSSLTIVKHYNLDKRDETIGLVQLISLIIPLPEKADIVLERAKEL